VVGEGLIDEEDFWNARRKLLLDEQGRVRGKQTGLPSNILAEIEARAMEGGMEGGKDGGAGGAAGGKTTICLKARDVQFLFELYPALKELYQKKVGREGGRESGTDGGETTVVNHALAIGLERCMLIPPSLPPSPLLLGP